MIYIFKSSLNLKLKGIIAKHLNGFILNIRLWYN